MNDMDNAQARDYYTELANYALEKIDDVQQQYPTIIGPYGANITRGIYKPWNLRIVAAWSSKAKNRLDDLEYQRTHFPVFQEKQPKLDHMPLFDLCWTQKDVDEAITSLKKQCEIMEESMNQKRAKP
ncbi:hypothetical protein QDX21_03345 [Auritidibacter ignavus]|uniref:Uncharacterized protein n=1 Tax=Auritidibacter ignavus TaxID=678932 RepID=A0AAJ6AI26_9MICC|nr:hypothetical protein [Auritidibacter ignavus]WGH91422.1 hypothetical protein QDX23_03385 [Auritidibacter ignavus]WGH93846.1 hypothetical protein QDX21_03345 [Auritidibacter ignavus]